MVRYQIAKLEFSLSRGGGLRSWFKLNILIGILLAIPLIFIAPVITFAFATVESWSGFLLQTLWNLFRALLLLVVIGGGLTAALFIVRARSSSKSAGKP